MAKVVDLVYRLLVRSILPLSSLDLAARRTREAKDVVVIVGQSLKAFEAKRRPRGVCSLDARAFVRVSPLPLLHTGGCQLVAAEGVPTCARVRVRMCVLPTYACLEKPVSWRPSSRFPANACFSRW